MLLKLDRRRLAKAHIDPECAADAAELAYVSDEQPGITRRRVGKGFIYFDARRRRITDDETIDRINRLAIPPAYKDVWICPDPHGHLQATGRDDRGRKQYRYHQRWAHVRDRAKFAKLIAFAEALPKLRRTLQRHLKLRGLPREKVLAACVMLLDRTYLRVGNDDYAKHNDSYGLTTLQDDHASFGRGGVVRLEYNGKHGIEREVELKDSRLAKIIKQCQDLPGQELLQYVDDAGNVIDIGSADVNDYLREHAGSDITAKDFRTWHATVLAATALRDEAPAEAKTARKKQILAAVDAVAQQLGNTRAICRKCYIHPITLEAFDAGDLKRRMHRAPAIPGLSKDESATLKLLKAKVPAAG
jgi:DNA topoisomerase-1